MDKIKQATTEAMQASINTPVQSVSKNNYQTVKGWLDKGTMRDNFFGVLGEQYAPAFMQTILLAMKAPTATALNKCDPATILRSAMVAATCGLTIDSNFSQSALIPYGDQCTFQVMKNGLEQLSMRTGMVRTFNCAEVYEGDIAEVNPFTGEMRYNQEPHSRDILIGYVAYIELINGFKRFTYMTCEEMKAHCLRYSKAYATAEKYGRFDSWWHKNPKVMGLKTVQKKSLKSGSILDPSATTQRNLILALKYDQSTPQTEMPTLLGTDDAIYPDALTAEESTTLKYTE